MLDALLSVFNWIVESISNILNLILSIPYYISKVTSMLNYVPVEIRVSLLLILSAVAIIKIKRLVF